MTNVRYRMPYSSWSRCCRLHPFLGPFEGCYEVKPMPEAVMHLMCGVTDRRGQFATFDSSGTYYVTVTDGNSLWVFPIL